MEQTAKQKRSKRKRAVIASVLALALVLSGTYAYQAISEAALNETYDQVNPGGRLHDDYDGQNKDIYVENFAQTPLLIRVRLDEFLEINGNIITTSNSATVVERDDPTTWTTYNPVQADLTQNVSNGNCNLTLGGQKWYMPTFNKSNGNLNPDQPNPRHSFDSTKDTIDPVTQKPWLGTAADVGEMPKYVDVIDGSYIAGLSGEPAEATAGYWDPGSGNDEKEDYELTWNRLGGASNTGATEKAANKTKHFPAETEYARVITMAEWKARNSGTGFNLDACFWVYDTDGWAYWSVPLYPGEATGLLLDSITFNYAQEFDWYYAINAVAQFATAESWDTEFGTDDASQTAGAPTADATALLEKAAKSIGVTGIQPGQTFVDAYSNITWRLLAEDGSGNMLLITNVSYAGGNRYDGHGYYGDTFVNFATAPGGTTGTRLYIKEWMNTWYLTSAGLLADYDLKWEPDNIPFERASGGAWPNPLTGWSSAWVKALSTPGSAEATDYTDVLFPLSLSDVLEYGSKSFTQPQANLNPFSKETLNYTNAVWLRSPGNGTNVMAYFESDGIRSARTYSDYGGLYYRPALWVKHLPIT